MQVVLYNGRKTVVVVVVYFMAVMRVLLILARLQT